MQHLYFKPLYAYFITNSDIYNIKSFLVYQPHIKRYSKYRQHRAYRRQHGSILIITAVAFGHNSSISHWDFAAADKVKALFHKYYEIIFQLECFKMSQAKFEEGVDRIIRLRNRTTHGNFASVSSEDAMVAVNLMNIIYISRLDRLGLSKDVIRHLIVRGVVY